MPGPAASATNVGAGSPRAGGGSTVRQRGMREKRPPAEAVGQPPGQEAPARGECGGSTRTTRQESKLAQSQFWSCPSFSSPAFSCYTSGENTTGRSHNCQPRLVKTFQINPRLNEIILALCSIF